MKSLLKFLSIILDPKYTFFLFLSLVALFAHNSWVEFIIILVFCGISLVYLKTTERALEEKDTHKFDNRDVRKVRYVTYILLIILAIILSTYSYLALDGQDLLFYILVGTISLILLIQAVIFKFKTSAHIVYSGLIIFYIFPNELKYPIFLALGVIIGYTRTYLGKHSLKQVVVAIMIVLTTYLISDLIAYVFPPL